MPRIFEFEGIKPQIDPTAYIAPGAVIIGNVRIAAGASVWFNAVLRGDNEIIEIGENSNVQDGAVIHTDIGYPVKIEANVTVGHTVILHGCHLEAGCLIGMGATVLNGAVISEGSLVGAGALVTEGKTFEPGQLIVGSPARAVRALDEGGKAITAGGSRFYTANSQRFAKSLKPV